MDLNSPSPDHPKKKQNTKTKQINHYLDGSETRNAQDELGLTSNLSEINPFPGHSFIMVSESPGYEVVAQFTSRTFTLTAHLLEELQNRLQSAYRISNYR